LFSRVPSVSVRRLVWAPIPDGETGRETSTALVTHILMTMILAAPTELPPAADAHNERGLMLYDQHRLTEALTEFRAAYDALPDVRGDRAARKVIFENIHFVLVQMHDEEGGPEALCQLDRLIREHVAALDAAFPELPGLGTLEYAGTMQRLRDRLGKFPPDACAPTTTASAPFPASPTPSSPAVGTRPPTSSSSPSPQGPTSAPTPSSPASAPSPPSTTPSSSVVTPTPASPPAASPRPSGPVGAGPAAPAAPARPGGGSLVAGAVLLPLGLAVLGGVAAVASTYRRDLAAADAVHDAWAVRPCTDDERERLRQLHAATQRGEGLLVALGVTSGVLLGAGVGLLVRGGLQRRRVRPGFVFQRQLVGLSLTGEF
jgi:hypothetical protein